MVVSSKLADKLPKRAVKLQLAQSERVQVFLDPASWFPPIALSAMDFKHNNHNDIIDLVPPSAIHLAMYKMSLLSIRYNLTRIFFESRQNTCWNVPGFKRDHYIST